MDRRHHSHSLANHSRIKDASYCKTLKGDRSARRPGSQQPRLQTNAAELSCGCSQVQTHCEPGRLALPGNATQDLLLILLCPIVEPLLNRGILLEIQVLLLVIVASHVRVFLEALL